MKKSAYPFFLFGLVMIILGAIRCTPSGGPGSGLGHATEASPPLTGTRWLLASFSQEDESLPVPSDPIPYLMMQDDVLYFEPGCSGVWANYRTSEGQLEVEGGLLRTIGCTGIISPEAIALELAFQSSLATWSNYETTGDELVIHYEGGELRFTHLVPTNPSLLRAFPVQKREEEVRGEETQSVQGVLTLDDGCLRFLPVDQEGERGYLVIWRDDHAVGLQDGIAAIFDTDGQHMGERVAGVGDVLSMSGRAIEQTEPLDHDALALDVPVPTECTGPYWVLDDFRPATRD